MILCWLFPRWFHAPMRKRLSDGRLAFHCRRCGRTEFVRGMTAAEIAAQRID